MEQVKISIKMGSLEMSYEGPQGFAESGLLELFEQFSASKPQDVVHIDEGAEAKVGGSELGSAESKLSTTDFAVRLGAKSGTDLAMAAAYYLSLTLRMDTFRRSHLLGAMRGAKQFYKTSYGGNLSKSLETLSKTGKLLTPGSDTYSLAYQEVEAAKRYL